MVAEKYPGIPLASNKKNGGRKGRFVMATGFSERASDK